MELTWLHAEHLATFLHETDQDLNHNTCNNSLVKTTKTSHALKATHFSTPLITVTLPPQILTTRKTKLVNAASSKCRLLSMLKDYLSSP